MGPYLRALRAHKLLVTLVVLAAVGGGVTWLALRSSEYEASAQLLVTPLPQDDTSFLGFQLLRDSGDPTRTVQTAATIVKSPEAAQRAAQRIGSGSTASKILDAIMVEPQGETNILAITATADDAALAARIANEFTDGVLGARQEGLRREIAATLPGLRTRLDSLDNPESEAAADLANRINQLEAVEVGADPTLSLSQRASVPDSPTGAGPVLIIVLALTAGLALGAGMAIILELLERRLRDEAEALSVYPLAVLARVPLLSRRERQGPADTDWFMPASVREAFRTLLVQLGEGNRSGRTIMVTSASANDGKTTSAINLAVALAANGARVILLDFDRKPDVGRKLNIEQTAILPHILDSDASLTQLLVQAPHIPSLRVLSTGADAGNVAFIEGIHRRLAGLVAEARTLADYVVLDTAPLGEVSDALRVADAVDDIVVVVRPGSTNRASLEITRDLLERMGRTPRGYLLIGARKGTSSGYYGYGPADRELFAQQLASTRSSTS